MPKSVSLIAFKQFFLIRTPTWLYRYSDEVFVLDVYQSQLTSRFDANAPFAFLVHGFVDYYPGIHSIQQIGSFSV